MERRIEASTQVRAPLDQARHVLVADPGSVLAEEASEEDRRDRRFHATLSLDSSGAGASVRHEVVIDVGPAGSVPEGGGVSLPLGWRALTLERLFPTFEGHLLLLPDGSGARLDIRGHYDVPLGPVGGFGDGLVGRRIARRSLGVFLEGIARRLDDEVDRRVSWSLTRPDSYPVAVREGVAPVG